MRTILAPKPYRRSLFFTLVLTGFVSPLWVHLCVVGNLGSFRLWVPISNVLVVPSSNGISWVMETERFKVWWSRLSRLVLGVCFGAGVGFFIEGYHFRIFYARIQKLGWRSLFFCRMGYFYNLLLVLPLHVRVFWRKRSFFLRGAFLSSFIALCFYLRMLRNLFPYKIKGVIYDNDRMARKNYEEALFALKPGKQDKQKQQR